MGQPDICVVVPTWNRAGFLPSAIRSVAEQTIDAAIEVVVADDGSTDQTLAVIERETARWAGRLAIRYVRIPRLGVCVARNTAIRQSIAPLVAFLDSDDEWEPDKLDAQVRLLTGSVRLVHTDFRYINCNGELLNPVAQRPNNPARGRCINSILAEDTVIFSSVLLTRNLLDEVAAAETHGLVFDTRWTNGQDYDLLLRAALLTEFDYCAAPLTRYRIHNAQNAMGNLARVFGYHCQVQIDFARRHTGIGQLVASAGQVAAADFLYRRAESHYWQRNVDNTRSFCQLAAELGIYDDRFATLYRRASYPKWYFAVKDAWDTALNRRTK